MPHVGTFTSQWGVLTFSALYLSQLYSPNCGRTWQEFHVPRYPQEKICTTEKRAEWKQVLPLAPAGLTLNNPFCKPCSDFPHQYAWARKNKKKQKEGRTD